MLEGTSLLRRRPPTWRPRTAGRSGSTLAGCAGRESCCPVTRSSHVNRQASPFADPTLDNRELPISEPPVLPEGGLRVVALGGIGEIGRNMTVFEYADRLLVV